MNCRSFHSRGQDPRCPYCVIRILYSALEKRDSTAPELTPASVILNEALEEERWHRRMMEIP